MIMTNASALRVPSKRRRRTFCPSLPSPSNFRAARIRALRRRRHPRASRGVHMDGEVSRTLFEKMKRRQLWGPEACCLAIYHGGFIRCCLYRHQGCPSIQSTKKFVQPWPLDIG